MESKSREQDSFIAIPGYEGIYEISRCGVVRSLDRTINKRDGTSQRLKGKIMSPAVASHGYLTVSLAKNGIAKSHCIHRLIAEMFIPSQEGKNQVNHKDGCKTNNSIENLEWVTQQENANHAFETGLAKSGAQHHSSKGEILAVNITTGEKFKMGGTKDITARGFNFYQVYRVANGILAKHKNHTFHWVKKQSAAGITVKGEGDE